MKQFILLLALALTINIVAGRAVSKKAPATKEEHPPDQPDDVADALEYERYLKEVVNALETDPEFRKKLDNATDVDIRSGKIANELEHVSHHVRSKLDEIKRREIERLRLAAIRHYELTNDLDREHLKISEPKHVDHENPHTFEIEDLKKLIHKTSEDLAEADKKRREEFKEYEMQKEFEKQEKLRQMDEDHRKQYEEELKRQHQKHNQHDPVHHPGNKAQLEEVWEKQDHMDPADFDPKTFFMMHDLDGNNFWDETEVKALFVKELDKVYQSGLPEDDMRERVEEMERMREHVFREADTNHDNLISLDEFIAQTKREEFNRDPNWETVDNQPQFTHQEYLEFERRRQEEVQRLIAQGVLPPHPNMPQGYYPNGQAPQYQYQHQQQQQQHGYPQQPVQLNQNQVYQHVDPNQHPQGYVNGQGQQYQNAPIQQQHAYVTGQNGGQVPNAHYQQPNAQYQQQPPSNVVQQPNHGTQQQQQQPPQAQHQQQQQQQYQQQPPPPSQQQQQQQQQQPPQQQNQQNQQNQQYQQQQPNSVPVANSQAQTNGQQPNQFQPPKAANPSDNNINQINANAKIDAKH